MSDTLGWVAAIGPAAIIATIGAWRTEATARWQARADPRASFAHFGHGTAVCAPCGTWPALPWRRAWRDAWCSGRAGASGG